MERLIPNARDTVRNGDTRQIRAAGERRTPDARDIVCQFYIFNIGLTHILIYCLAPKYHFFDTGGVKHRIFAGSIRRIIVNRFQRSGFIENLRPDGGDGCRNADFCNAGTTVKRAGSDFGHGIWDSDRNNIGASCKSIVTDGGYFIAFGVYRRNNQIGIRA